MKYTHFPEAEDPAHHVNRHWFIYRREAVVSLRLERELAGEVAVGLLYGEVRRCLVTALKILCNSNLGKAKYSDKAVCVLSTGICHYRWIPTTNGIW